MEGLGKIPYVNGWVVFTASAVLLFLGAVYSSSVVSFLSMIAAAIPAPLTGNLIFVVLLLSGTIALVLKVLDAPKPRLGSGKRFASLERQLARRPGVKNPSALAAHIGRQKYGKQRFQKLAVQGQRRR